MSVMAFVIGFCGAINGFDAICLYSSKILTVGEGIEAEKSARWGTITVGAIILIFSNLGLLSMKYFSYWFLNISSNFTMGILLLIFAYFLVI